MVRFKMLARDIDAFPSQYRTWIVEDEPDLTGSQYTGYKSGDHDLEDISAYLITDNSVVADFNLPDPLNWSTTFKELPEAIYGSHLAVVDGYIYLFGGVSTNKIFRAHVNNPADWEDTGATLPTNLSEGQLAVIDDTIYIFGGKISSATNNIYSARTSDPLTWTNHGALLPIKLYKSQLAIVDGYAYLFGGLTDNNATDVILKASTLDPLTWADTGETLPTKLYDSHLAVIDGYIYLFGGRLLNNSASNEIYKTSTSSPESWEISIAGYLPTTIFSGQFLSIGSKGYLISSSTTSSKAFTRILRCELSNPLVFNDTNKTIPGEISQSQLAIIYDRIFLFGGNGNSVIFANKSKLKYKFDNTSVVNYGSVTRTDVAAAPTTLDLFMVLGFPPWKTDYGA